MKKLIVLLLLGIAVYVFFVDSPFKKDLSFDGKIYSHLKDVDLGFAHNHIYTLNGQSVGSSKSFIQIFELNEKIQKKLWKFQLAVITDKYKLIAIPDSDSEFSGSPKAGGLFFNTFAAPIRVKNQDDLALFVINTGKNKETVSISRRDEILKELKGLELVFK